MEDYKKKYEEALQRARGLYKEFGESEDIAVMVDLGLIFPELRESEDERIRKLLVEAVTQVLQDQYCSNRGVSKEKVIAWLEKQGEPNTVVVIPKFRVGDVIRSKGSMAEYTIESISGECYHGKGWGLHISCDDDYELVKQNPAWSEEDERNLQGIIDEIEANKNHAPYYDFATYDRFLSWLKSLKERYTWKPSDLPHWKKSTLPNDNTTGFNSDYFCHKGYNINYKELFEKLPKDD